ncbi:MAG: exo-alpha-sialidase [Prevotella sp.]|nr:exo-alpha-sialidase [Prevotella sp.]
MNKLLLLFTSLLMAFLPQLGMADDTTDIQWPITDATYQINIGELIKSEAELTDGGFYVIYQPRNNCCIEEASNQKLMLNGMSYSALNGSTNTTYVMKLLKQDDGTWQIQTSTGHYFPIPSGESNLFSADVAGNYALNFNADGYIFPRITVGDVTYGLDRASSGVYAYTKLNNTAGKGNAQCYQIYPVTFGEEQGPEEIEEFTAYQIVNANGRGMLYYSPDNSGDFVWSTGKNDSKTAAENYQWVFVKTENGDYNIFNIGRRAYIEPTDKMGSYKGKTWVFTQNKVGITLENLTSTNYSIRTTADNTYMSVSNGYDGPVISYYQAGDGGVPFYFVKGDAVSDDVRDMIVNGITDIDERDVSVRQGYQTVGRNNERAVLLRMSVMGNIEATINSITIQLKGNTRQDINSLSVYQCSNMEFYAEENPTLLGTIEPTGDEVVLPLNYALKSGTNYLWLTADISDEATLGETIDAKLTSIDYTYNGESSSVTIPATIGDPTGEAKIFATQSFAFLPTTDNCRFYRIPAMILDKEGNIVVAADRRYGSNADLGNHKIDVSIRRSEDGGRTWSAQNIIAVGDGSSSTDYGYGDPALARTQNGRLICMMAAGSTMYWNGMSNAAICTSDDNGLTWTKPRQLYTSNFYDAVNDCTNSLGFYGNFISSGKGLTTFDGTVMFTNNCLTNEDHSSPQLYIISSTDEGENWQMGPGNAYAGCDESKLEQLNDGRLMVSVRQSGSRGFNRGSADGTTWDKQYRNNQISGNACNADILYYSRSTDGDQDVMLHTYVKSSARENLTLAMSINEGRTWKDVLNIQPGGAAYSTMIRLANGDLAIFYEDESYSAGNGYALNFVTVTREQILAFAHTLGIDEAPSYEEKVGTSSVLPGIYNPSGQRIASPQSGLNIIHQTDGSVIKIIKK